MQTVLQKIAGADSDAGVQALVRDLIGKAGFGEDLAKAFNQTVGSNAYLSEASRPFATLLFLEAAKAFDVSLTGSVDALMDITVIRSGKLTVDDMLAGKIAAAPEIILCEQPFAQA